MLWIYFKIQINAERLSKARKDLLIVGLFLVSRVGFK